MADDFEDKGRKRGKKSALNKDDLSLWKRFTADIDPLAPVDWDGLEQQADPASAVPDAPRERIYVPVVPAPPPPASPAQPPQLDRRTEEKLRKGKMDIEARIDLHGHSQQRAYEVLQQFVTSSHHRGMRCVLVITGKGRSYEDDDQEWVFNDSVLRQRVPQWLMTPPLSALTLKYFPAQPRHGGEGAYYVYLRRARDYSP